MFLKKFTLVFASVLLITSCMAAVSAWANDGAFYASGNHLIPITETDIRVQKEILTLNRVGDSIQVNVYYEFFNPVAEKEVLVGFEAQPPSVDFNKSSVERFPGHPYMSDFKVVMNGQTLPYEIAHVLLYHDNDTIKEPPYYVNGKIQAKSADELELTEWLTVGEAEAVGHPLYVYHFKARFRPGLNIIQHTYNYHMSESQMPIFVMMFAGSFDYTLTAANRWANNQIDDFTLNINMGDHTSFCLYPMFFNSPQEWQIQGKGKYFIEPEPDENMKYTMQYASKGKQGIRYHMQNGTLTFHKENFHPERELYINEVRRLSWESPSWRRWDSFDTAATQLVIDCFRYEYLPTRLYSTSTRENLSYDKFTPQQRRILKNLPFAYRGYVFKSKELQDFFESTPWYIPDPDYGADVQTLTPDEQKWVEFWGE